MALLSDLLPLLREKCSGMLDQQALDQLKKAYRTFCIESGYLQNSETVQRNADNTITFYPPVDHYIQSINLVIETKNGKELTKGVEYIVDHAMNVTLASDYDEVFVVYSVAPILPIDNNADVDDSILQRWPDELASGAAALLRRMPNREWTDYQLADFYYRDFVKGHREAYQTRIASNDEIQFKPYSNRVFF